MRVGVVFVADGGDRIYGMYTSGSGGGGCGVRGCVLPSTEIYHRPAAAVVARTLPTLLHYHRHWSRRAKRAQNAHQSRRRRSPRQRLEKGAEIASLSISAPGPVARHARESHNTRELLSARCTTGTACDPCVPVVVSSSLRRVPDTLVACPRSGRPRPEWPSPSCCCCATAAAKRTLRPRPPSAPATAVAASAVVPVAIDGSTGAPAAWVSAGRAPRRTTGTQSASPTWT